MREADRGCEQRDRDGAKRDMNLEKAAELQYGKLPQLQKQLEDRRGKGKIRGSVSCA